MVQERVLLRLAEAVPALAQVDDERILLEGRSRPREMEQDDEVREVRGRKCIPFVGAPLELREAREALEDARVDGEEILAGEAHGGRIPFRRGRSRDFEERVRSAAREEVDLVEKRGHEVRGVVDARLLREKRGQVEVILQRMEAHPRERGWHAVERRIPRLVEVPQEDDAERRGGHAPPFYRPGLADTSCVRLLESPSPGPRMSSGPARRSPPNRVRSGRKQHSGERSGRRGSPGLIGGLGERQAEEMHEHARPSRSANRKRLAAVLALAIALLVIEAAAGFLTRSQALLADAAHMLADVGALTLALVAMRFAERPATPQKTFGFYRVEILAACVNSAALTVLAGLILFEAWDRLRTPAPVKAVPMLIVAAAALAVNVGSMLLLRRGAEASLNVKGAYLEVFSDALMSLGVLAAGVTISLTGWYGADAVASAAIGLFILPRTWRLLKEAVGILLEGTPSQVSLVALRDALRAIPGVQDVHDLHVWALTSGVHAMSAHIVRADDAVHDDLLDRVRDAILLNFAIHHVTLQVESAGCVETHA